MSGGDTESWDNPEKLGILGRYACGMNTLASKMTTEELPPQKLLAAMSSPEQPSF